jgi:hypothetical protein
VVLHSDASGVAFMVGDAKLVANVVAGGPAVAVGPKDMAPWVGWTYVLTAALPEPATAVPGSDVTLITSADAISAPTPMVASSFVVVVSLMS